MVYRILADVVVCLHMLLACFIGLGLILILVGGAKRWRWVRHRPFRLTHLGTISIVVGLSWFGVECPLTTLEKWLRVQAGDVAYAGDFIARWVHDLLFIDAPTWAFTVAYTVFGAAVVASLWFVPPARRTN